MRSSAISRFRPLLGLGFFWNSRSSSSTSSLARRGLGSVCLGGGGAGLGEQLALLVLLHLGEHQQLVVVGVGIALGRLGDGVEGRHVEAGGLVAVGVPEHGVRHGHGLAAQAVNE